MVRIQFLDPEQQALIMDAWNKIETAMMGVQKIFEELPKDVRDPLLAMLLSQYDATTAMVDVYNKFQSFYEEIKGLQSKDGKFRFPFLERILRIRYIQPKQKMLLAMQKLIARLKHALEEVPQDPRARKEWDRLHAAQAIFDIGELQPPAQSEGDGP